jgi:predicted RecA/RadA family phage recombinase
MAVASYLYDGDRVYHTSGSDVPVGTVLLIGDTVSVADRPLVANVLGSVAVEGIFSMPKAAEAISLGVVVYWDNTNGVITTTATNNKRAGKSASAAASGDATVHVNLNVG